MTLTPCEKQALYHLDMVLWVREQPWHPAFKVVLENARDFRDALARELTDDKTDQA